MKFKSEGTIIPLIRPKFIVQRKIAKPIFRHVKVISYCIKSQFQVSFQVYLPTLHLNALPWISLEKKMLEGNT